MKKTKVIFLKDEDGVFAFFPQEQWSNGFKTSYAHVGQHSACDEDYANLCEKATEEEYRSLENELKSIGYALDIENQKSDITIKKGKKTARITLNNQRTKNRFILSSGVSIPANSITIESGSVNNIIAWAVSHNLTIEQRR